MEFRRQVVVNFGELEWQGLTKVARRDDADLPQMLRRLSIERMQRCVPSHLHINPTPEQQREIDSKTPTLEEAYEDEKSRPIWIEQALHPEHKMTAVEDPILLAREIKRAKRELADATREKDELTQLVQELELVKLGPTPAT
jgi:hypothetical protein